MPGFAPGPIGAAGLSQAEADFADGVAAESGLEFLEESAFPNPFEFKVNGGLKDVDDQEPVAEAGGRGVFGQEFSDDFFPGERDFLFFHPLLEAELGEQLVDRFRDGP